MYLFTHEDTEDLVVIGEKNIHRFVKRDMKERGFKYRGAFNASWGAFTEEFTQIENHVQYDKFIQTKPITLAYRVRKLESIVTKLQRKGS